MLVHLPLNAIRTCLTNAGAISDTKTLQALALDMQTAIELVTCCPQTAAETGLIHACTRCISSVLVADRHTAEGKQVRRWSDRIDELMEAIGCTVWTQLRQSGDDSEQALRRSSMLQA